MHFLTGASRRLDWAMGSWTIPNRTTRGTSMATQTISKRTSAIHPPIQIASRYVSPRPTPPARCVRRPMLPDGQSYASPHSAHLYAPPSPVFWFARSLKRPNQASEAREIQDLRRTRKPTRWTSSRESNEHQISANAARQTKNPIVASMTCPTVSSVMANDQPSSNF